MASHTLSEYIKLDAKRRQHSIAEFTTENIDHFLDSFLPMYLPSLLSTGILREHVVETIKYNTIGGKMIRGTLSADVFLQTIKALFPGLIEDTNLSDKLLSTAVDICLVHELLQASFLVVDDIVDHSKTRRGKPSWRTVVGDEQAANDSLILLQMADCLLLYLENRCGKTLKISEVYANTKLYTILGQHLDSFTRADVHKYTMGHINDTYVLKTAYYTFYLPLMMGYRAGILFGNIVIGSAAVSNVSGADIARVDSIMELQQHLDSDIEQRIYSVSMDLGRLFQMQDDFLDLYAPELLNKASVDYKDSKASWTIVRALELCGSSCAGKAGSSAVTREMLIEAYGKESSDREKIIKLFNELGLKDVYTKEATALLEQCRTSLASLPPYISICVQGIFAVLSSRTTLEGMSMSK